jgi:hypothetical protein
MSQAFADLKQRAWAFSPNQPAHSQNQHDRQMDDPMTRINVKLRIPSPRKKFGVKS